MKLFLLLMAALVAAACQVPQQTAPPGTDTAPAAQPTEQEQTVQREQDEADDVTVPEPEVSKQPDFQYPFLGSSPVSIVIYGDYASGTDTQVNNFQVAALERDYVKSNKAKIVFKPYPLGGDDSWRAARASLCMWEQGSKQFWNYHDVLHTFYLRLDEESLNNYAGRVPNADKEKFAECLASEKYKDVIIATRAYGDSIGIGKTPSFVIGEETIIADVNVPYKTFKDAVDKELKPDQNLFTGSVVFNAVSATRSLVGWLLGQFS
ncbi:thioredoxin domain-containing protein [Candidatus Woesearchaeota archaeon]|nr:thioredoxin domain-containing protein [Candidatus Woesearchaeota archaeon]